MKVVVNKCFGGFGLSDKAYERLIELGIPCFTYKELENAKPEPEFYIIYEKRSRLSSSLNEYYSEQLHEDKSRTHPLLIQVVEELGQEANGDYAELEIIEIPDDVQFEIDYYDGIESIHEIHRSW